MQRSANATNRNRNAGRDCRALTPLHVTAKTMGVACSFNQHVTLAASGV